MSKSASKPDPKKALPRVKMSTSVGDMVIDLYEDDAPNTVYNFVSLVGQGFYDGLTFHRVIPGFVAQGGDPQGNGGGGPGYCIKLEVKQKHTRGAIAMARTNVPDSAGSQFYFVLDADACSQLDSGYAVFGQIVEGLDVMDKIKIGTTIKKAEVVSKRDHAYEVKKLPAR